MQKSLSVQHCRKVKGIWVFCHITLHFLKYYLLHDFISVIATRGEGGLYSSYTCLMKLRLTEVE